MRMVKSFWTGSLPSTTTRVLVPSSELLKKRPVESSRCIAARKSGEEPAIEVRHRLFWYFSTALPCLMGVTVTR